MSSKKVIMCDIDGCLLDTSEVLKEAEEKSSTIDEKWEYFEKYANDPKRVPFNHKLGEFLKIMYKNGYKIVFSTARSMKISESTITRIQFELGIPAEIMMRNIADSRPSEKIKQEHLYSISQDDDVYLAIDDEDNNLEMYKNNGVFALKPILSKYEKSGSESFMEGKYYDINRNRKYFYRCKTICKEK